ncbi:DIP1984 family protein [Acinetobacter sichuanensis]|uniref:DIP1984 family protein n=1 Tax=Acinetobacter sichuanensis TaxID=2136183 RepID=A0A371YSI9_9GAMM|nr:MULTISPECIES: DIP1984 family protein [Acinetobacter]MDM1763217.1 DIP1984 family protein [Acinetobacter sp. 226-1]MDM1766696.1 DIP1984 family protein [Acinetobacter sp. 226-4]MDQ9020237.1 DIP1984 family protein [Acinetobacter sichuanensis]RFC84415.1 septicolysin [Acinetobacter sichuanensis]
MKVAEALLIKSDHQKKLTSLKQRININVLVKDGEEPSEDPNELIKQAFSISQDLQGIISNIYLTYARTKLSDGRSFINVINQRDDLIEKQTILMQAIENSEQFNRCNISEVKWKKIISVARLQKQADEISMKIRELNMKIQEANWQIEMYDPQKSLVTIVPPCIEKVG